MKIKSTIYLTITIVFIGIFAFGQSKDTKIKAMSYNIKYDNTNDTMNNWNDRKNTMVQLLLKHAPDFIGMQEVLHRQLTYLDTALSDYTSIGIGRDDGKEKGEYSPIFYNNKKYTLLQSNTFWLSKTPNEVSVGWDASMERICSYGLFENRDTKQKLWVFNTHFDHIGVKARKKSAQLILKKIRTTNTDGFPVILMGDFNLTPDQKPIKNIKKKMLDGLEHTKTKFTGPVGSFNGFNTNEPMVKRIDYIFVTDFKVKSYTHLDERLHSGKHISDHLPVLIALEN